MNGSTPPTVVVSYSHEGGDVGWKAEVAEVVAGLRRAGVDVAFDGDHADREVDWKVFGPSTFGNASW
jgi:selenocysteine lyase/cysteine desulfurase